MTVVWAGVFERAPGSATSGPGNGAAAFQGNPSAVEQRRGLG